MSTYHITRYSLLTGGLFLSDVCACSYCTYIFSNILNIKPLWNQATNSDTAVLVPLICYLTVVEKYTNTNAVFYCPAFLHLW